MAKNLCVPAAREALRQRIAAVQADQAPVWGKMSAPQMVCHLADQLRLATGEIKVPDQSTFISRNLVRRLVLAGMPIPKGKIKTFPEIDQQSAGTSPTDFETDKQLVFDLMERVGNATDRELAAHSFFGKLSPQAWGRLAWFHMDHHLRQFDS